MNASSKTSEYRTQAGRAPTLRMRLDRGFSCIAEAAYAASRTSAKHGGRQRIITDTQRAMRFARGTFEMPVLADPVLGPPAADAPIVITMSPMPAVEPTRAFVAVEPEPVSVRFAEPASAPMQLELLPRPQVESCEPDLIFSSPVSAPAEAAPRAAVVLGARDFASVILTSVLLSLGTLYVLSSAGIGPG